MVSLRTALVAAVCFTSGFALQTAEKDIRPLRALRRNLKNQVRDNTIFQTSTQLRLHYVDEGTLHHDVPFGATLNIETKKPAVVLEHFESVLNGVQCSPAGIHLGFSSEPQAKKARESWNSQDLIVVTSHSGCNNDGERVPYLISDIAFGSSSAMLYGHPISWRNASRNLDLEFGAASLELRSTDTGLSRRADAVTKDIGFSLVDQTIFSQDGITQKCKSCTGQATFAISGGAVKLVDDFENLFKSFGKDGLNLQDIVDAADVDIVATNMGAKFEFETDIMLSKSFSFHLAGGPVSLTGFSIAGVVSIGPSIDPVLVIDIKMIDPIKFTYGFDLAVPDGSSLNIDIVNLFGSKTSGFDQTKFNALPLQVNDPRLGANFSVAFRPVLELGLSVLEIDLQPVVVFADVPKFEGTIELLPNADDNCKPTKTGNPQVSFNADFVLDIGVGIDIELTDQIKLNPRVTLAQTTLFPFSTCFGFGGQAAPTNTQASLLHLQQMRLPLAPQGLEIHRSLHRRRQLSTRPRAFSAGGDSTSSSEPSEPSGNAPTPAPLVSTVTVVPIPAETPKQAYGGQLYEKSGSETGYLSNQKAPPAEEENKEVEPAYNKDAAPAVEKPDCTSAAVLTTVQWTTITKYPKPTPY